MNVRRLHVRGVYVFGFAAWTCDVALGEATSGSGVGAHTSGVTARAGRLPRVLALGALAVTVGTLAMTTRAESHARGCTFPRPQPPVGSTERVYAIPHGCVRLVVAEDERTMPTVVVRQHARNGRVVVRRFPLPDSNLDRAGGSVGICTWAQYLFFVAYPFVTVVTSELYDFGGRGECTGLNESLLWTGQLSSLPSLSMTWYTHRPAG
jgi:hypothetical protein